MDHIPAPGVPTAAQRFIGGFRQAWGESLAPGIGRIALAGIAVILAFAAVVGVLAAVYG